MADTPAASARLGAEELAALVCPECGHGVLRYHTNNDCDYHNSCRCSLTNAEALAVLLADRAQHATAALDPAYRDIEVCACSTPGWTHHTGFHMFVADRSQRAAKAALDEVGRRVSDALYDTASAQIVGRIIREVRAALTADQPTAGGDEAAKPFCTCPDGHDAHTYEGAELADLCPTHGRFAR